MATSTQTSAVKPAATTAYLILIPVTVYNLAQNKIQEIPNPVMRRFQGEENPFTPKATSTTMAPPTREDTSWSNTTPASNNLLVTRASWQIPPNETSMTIFVKTEKAEGRIPPKIAAIPCMMPPQNKVEEMCRWGLHCPICTKFTPNPKAESSEDWNGKSQDQLQRNYHPQSPQYSPSYDILDRFSEQYKIQKDRKEGLEFLSDKNNPDYYSSSDSDSEPELEHRYETLISSHNNSKFYQITEVV